MKQLFLYIPLLLLFVGCSSPSTEAPVEELDGTLDGLTLAYPIELSYDFMDANGDYRWQYYYGGEYDGEGQPLYRVDFSMYYKDGYVPDMANDIMYFKAETSTRVSGPNYVDTEHYEVMPLSSYERDHFGYVCKVLNNNNPTYIKQGYKHDVRFSFIFTEVGWHRLYIYLFDRLNWKSYITYVVDFEILDDENSNQSASNFGGKVLINELIWWKKQS